jgi:lycopene elongase/hydratase (dihydrobisanhydrobacterioruberin-forming)
MRQMSGFTQTGTSIHGGPFRIPTLEISSIGVPDAVRPYVANVRMGDWGGYIGMSLLGYLLGLTGTGIDYIGFLVYMAAVALYLGFSFSVNNCFDHAGDRLGDKASKNPIALDQMSVRSGIIFSAALAASGLALTAIWFGSGPALLYAVMLLLSGAYSTPPIRFKSIPVVDMLSHGLFFGALIVLFGVSVAGGSNPLTFFVLADVFVVSLTLELLNQIGDATEDAKSGVKTTAIMIGIPSANKLLYALLIAHVTMLSYITSQLGSLLITGVLMVFLVGVAYQLLRVRGKDRFLFLLEKITPLVYLIFVVAQML